MHERKKVYVIYRMNLFTFQLQVSFFTRRMNGSVYRQEYSFP